MNANISEYPQTVKSEKNDYISERLLREKEVQRAFEIIEEKSWERDKIWKIISSNYEKMQVPEYISKKFVRSLIKVESADYKEAISRCGARGLGQIMEGTWYIFEKEDFEKNAFIPEKNIAVTIKCLVWADKFCNENHPNWNTLSNQEKLSLISACYNMGPYGTKRSNWDINKMPAETRNYIPAIKRTMKKITPVD
jgi:hypothetical protein